MKSAVLKALGGVVAVMVACNVYAQASDAAAGAQTAQTSAAAHPIAAKRKDRVAGIVVSCASLTHRERSRRNPLHKGASRNAAHIGGHIRHDA